jgi:CSN7 helical bundle subdomain
MSDNKDSVPAACGYKLEQFLVLANGCTGKAASAVIAQVLSKPSIFIYGELLHHKNIAAVCVPIYMLVISFSLLSPVLVVCVVLILSHLPPSASSSFLS